MQPQTRSTGERHSYERQVYVYTGAVLPEEVKSGTIPAHLWMDTYMTKARDGAPVFGPESTSLLIRGGAGDSFFVTFTSMEAKRAYMQTKALWFSRMKRVCPNDPRMKASIQDRKAGRAKTGAAMDKGSALNPEANEFRPRRANANNLPSRSSRKERSPRSPAGITGHHARA